MCLEPPVFLYSQRGDELAGLSRRDDRDIVGKGLFAPDVVVVIMTVDHRGYWSGKQSRNSRPQVGGGLGGNKGVVDKHPISQVADAGLGLGPAAFGREGG